MHTKTTLFTIIAIFVLCFRIFPQQVSLNNELIAYYPFNNNFDDAAGHRFNATADKVDFTFDQQGNKKSAVRLYGNSIIACTGLDINPALYNTITIALWVKPEVTDRRQVIVSNDSSGRGRGIVIDKSNNQWGYSAFSGDNVLTGSLPVIKFWTLLLATYESGKVELRVISVKGDNKINSTTNIDPGYKTVYIGDVPLNSKMGFYGDMDEVRFYSRRLNEGEIQCLFTGCPVVSSTNPPPNPIKPPPPPPPPPPPNGCNKLPGDPSDILCSIDPDYICQSLKSVRFRINKIECADQYEWLLPVVGTIVTNDPAVVFNLPPDLTSGTVSVKGINKKGAGNSKALNIKIIPTLDPGKNFSISGLAFLCGEHTKAIYTVSFPSGHRYYFNWISPSNARIFHYNSDSTTVDLEIDPGSFRFGTLIVTGKDRCGTAATTSLGIAYKDKCKDEPKLCDKAPEMPGPIKCDRDYYNLCRSDKTVMFSVDPVLCATTYRWVLPNGEVKTIPDNFISVDVSSSLYSGSIMVHGVSDKGIGPFRSLTLRYFPMPVLKEHAWISGEKEICDLKKTYTYSVTPPYENNYKFNWILPKYSSLVKLNENTQSVEIRFDEDKFFDSEIKVFGQNKCGSSDTLSFSMKCIAARGVKYEVSGPKTAKPGDEATYSVLNSFIKAEKYNWKTTRGINILGPALTVKAGTLYDKEVRVRFNDQLDKDTLYVRGYNSTCGLSNEYVVIVITKGLPITGTTEVCASVSAYSYKLAPPPKGVTTFNWKIPKYARIIEDKKDGPEIHVRFNNNKFDADSISVSYVDGKETKTASLFVKNISPRFVKNDITKSRVLKSDIEERFSVGNSFANAEKYLWRCTNGIKIVTLYTAKLGDTLLYPETVYVTVSEPGSKDTLFATAFNSSCGFGDTTIAIPVTTEQLVGNNYLKPFNQKVKCVYGSFSLLVNSLEITKWKDRNMGIDTAKNPTGSFSQIQDCNDGKGTKFISCSGNNFSYSYKDEFGSYKISGELSPKGDVIKTCTITHTGTEYMETKNFSLTVNSIPGKRFSQKRFVFTTSYANVKSNHVSDYHYELIKEDIGNFKTSTPLDKATNLDHQDIWVYFDFE